MSISAYWTLLLVLRLHCAGANSERRTGDRRYHCAAENNLIGPEERRGAGSGSGDSRSRSSAFPPSSFRINPAQHSAPCHFNPFDVFGCSAALTISPATPHQQRRTLNSKNTTPGCSRTPHARSRTTRLCLDSPASKICAPSRTSSPRRRQFSTRTYTSCQLVPLIQIPSSGGRANRHLVMRRLDYRNSARTLPGHLRP